MASVETTAAPWVWRPLDLWRRRCARARVAPGALELAILLASIMSMTADGRATLTCSPSLKYLAHALGVDNSGLGKRINALARAGLLIVDKGGGRGKLTVYRAVVEIKQTVSRASAAPDTVSRAIGQPKTVAKSAAKQCPIEAETVSSTRAREVESSGSEGWKESVGAEAPAPDPATAGELSGPTTEAKPLACVEAVRCEHSPAQEDSQGTLRVEEQYGSPRPDGALVIPPANEDDPPTWPQPARDLRARLWAAKTYNAALDVLAVGWERASGPTAEVTAEIRRALVLIPKMKPGAPVTKSARRVSTESATRTAREGAAT